jgi:methionyl-tRNA formyltransferase
MRVAYLGTAPFAAAILRTLAGSSHRPVLVVSRPDRRQGRGRALSSSPVVQAARELELPVLQPESVNAAEAVAQIAAAQPQCLVICAFGAIIREPLLSRFGPILNVHPSLLPRWRGAAPIERALLAGDRRTGVSIMQVVAGLDSGPVGLQSAVDIAADDDYGSLAGKLQAIGGDLLVQALTAQGGLSEPLSWQPQDDDLATYAEKLSAADRRLDPEAGASANACRVRALSPHIGAYVELADGSHLGVWQAREVAADGSAPSALPGIERDTSGVPVWHCRDGAFALEVVQPQGRRRMGGADYLRGLRR